MRKLFKPWKYTNLMTPETITITKKEYKDLKEQTKVDQDLLKDIAKGIKDILKGKVKEV